MNVFKLCLELGNIGNLWEFSQPGMGIQNHYHLATLSPALNIVLLLHKHQPNERDS